MSYQVRLADLEEVRERLLPIWAENLPVHGELAAKLRWFYSDGPHGPGHPFVIQPDRGTVLIGSAGIGVRTLWLHDRQLRAALFADLAIERSHRSGFPALALIRAVKQHVTSTFDLGYGFPNAKAAAVYRHTGYRQLGEMRRYVRMLRSSSRLRLPRVVSAVLDRGLAAADRVRALRYRRSYELAWLDTFDARFDRLWQDARHLAPILCERSAKFLTWRFANHPGYRYRIAALVESATLHVRGYAILRDVDGGAELADLFGATMSEIDVLLARLLPSLYDQSYESVAIRFLGIPQIVKVLARHGFVVRPESRMVTIAVGDKMIHKLELVDPGSWYMTDLDEDS